ncbi:MAG: prepilin-type N-terminal cleavage/methylation domain-containing protein [Candidatus Angelobacter sp.]
MKTASSKSVAKHVTRPSRKQLFGFTLVELMVAMAVFMVVGGAAVSLIRKHVPLYATEQNQATLNVAMRNAVAQMQTDVVNAGSGFYPGANMPFFPVGITIANNAAGFDSLNVIIANDTIPPAHPSGNPAGTAGVDLSAAGGNLYLVFSVTPAPTAAQLNTWATTIFTRGTELLLIQGGTDFSNSSPKMTTVVLTSAVGDVQGTSIHVTHDLTTAAGVPAVLPDPMKIINPNDDYKCISTFDPAQDYAIGLTGTTYSIDTTDPTNSKLVRTPLGVAAGAKDVIAEQIVGFKVGAWSSPWSLAVVPPAEDYSFNAAVDYKNDWTTVRAVKINLMARTPPNSDPTNSSFRNKFDGGPYQVQSISVVINPRNLSM